jgi:ABC-type multidrug transport system fused ATPase/permease subunit
LTVGLVAWVIMLWRRGDATTGEVVLVCTLGLSILHATRDLAVALVDVTQHMARLSEALATLLIPHELCDHLAATPLVRNGAAVTFENVGFRYSDGSPVFENFTVHLDPGQRVGLARISHTIECIGAANQRKLLCCNDLSPIRGAPRCPQSVPRISLGLNPLKDARW